MPFTGWFDRFGYSHPSSHGPDAAPFDWHTDLYKAPDASVRAYATASTVPQSQITLKVVKRYELAGAGTSLELDVKVYETWVGRIKYAHLKNVPNWTAGTTLPNGQILGQLHLWPPGQYWQVNGPTGVHTHFGAGNVNYHGYSCYINRASGTELAAGAHIAWVGTTRATAAKQAC
jgi:hypothetical protein